MVSNHRPQYFKQFVLHPWTIFIAYKLIGGREAGGIFIFLGGVVCRGLGRARESRRLSLTRAPTLCTHECNWLTGIGSC